VMTGYRVALGGAQARFGVRPDLTTLGKVVGGGLPVGAYGGRADLMAQVAPAGPMYQAGTLSGNPLAMAAGIATLERITEAGTYEALEQTAAALEAGLSEAIEKTGADAHVQRVGTMLALYFTRDPVWDADDARRPDAERFARFHRAMLERGIYLPPSRVEAWFVGLAHDEEAVTRTVEAARESLSVAAG
jgi:glutamate-1-semialdehyde 2,1-aminomutase